MTRTESMLFGIRRSVRYHNHRRRFYEMWNSVTITFAAVTSAAAGTAFSFEIVGWLAWLPAVASFLVALFSALDLGIGTASSANLHAELARKFIELEKRFAHGKELSDEEYENIVRDRLEIEANEPTVLRLLDIMCHFELLRAQGDRREHLKIPLWRRKAAHWISQPNFAQEFAGKYYNTKTVQGK